MKKYPIRLRGIDEATAFIKATTKYEYDMDLCKGEVIIDAKSILGVLSICSDDDLELSIYNNDHKDILESLSDFLINKKTA
ncbi:MAG TPA: PTS sugar transporter [Lachnoclostridium sp.]|uniref:HPr family phosphocarrier protein n=1 Tax=Lacrimispora sp. TaxID=2719234 RepID=UPI000EE56C69|nr:HPr family phosphocarrier protein [Lacrimispora sp.]HCD45718.1 PTS sugar transporter [Lachnoclostridium sp.]